MKKLIIYTFAALAVTFASCSGSSKTENSQADSGQVHVGAESPADSNKYTTTPNETGGQDTSANGVVPPSDTTKPAP